MLRELPSRRKSQGAGSGRDALRNTLDLEQGQGRAIQRFGLPQCLGMLPLQLRLGTGPRRKAPGTGAGLFGSYVKI